MQWMAMRREEFWSTMEILELWLFWKCARSLSWRASNSLLQKLCGTHYRFASQHLQLIVLAFGWVDFEGERHVMAGLAVQQALPCGVQTKCTLWWNLGWFFGSTMVSPARSHDWCLSRSIISNWCHPPARSQRTHLLCVLRETCLACCWFHESAQSGRFMPKLTPLQGLPLLQSCLFTSRRWACTSHTTVSFKVSQKSFLHCIPSRRQKVLRSDVLEP